MFYLKYRPKTIEEIDNIKAKEVLKNILKSPSLPHAFLFSGQKGTGKTSSARIFAKTVNCQNNLFSSKSKSIEPCNKCFNCLSIENSSSTDVIEIDAASNRGIDDIRNLIKTTSFLPMSNRFRIFIIDEAHMITHDAFNALLKTLEEPPASVIFILATTNEEKIPKTILSRCSIVKFGKGVKRDIINMLKRISVSEKIEEDNKLFSLIADYCEDSFRDAAKIFEELKIQNKLNHDEAKKFLGIFKQDLLELIEKKDIKNVFEWVEDFNQQGGNFKILIESLLNQLHDLLLFKNGVNNELKMEYGFSNEELVKLIKYLTVAYQNLRISPIESLPLEIAIVEFYNQVSLKIN